jgi:ActR/RegA family two-component response regulator
MKELIQMSRFGTAMILAVGDFERDEFAAAWAALQRLGPVAIAADLGTAIASVCRTATPGRLDGPAPAEGEGEPAAIILAQSYPGQFAAAAIERLQALAPLARIVVVAGSWCEGEMRSGRPWPGAIRLYACQAEPRLRRELAALLAGEPTPWTLPPTATEEERLLAAAERDVPPRQGQVAIFGRRAALTDWLAAACRQRGYTATIAAPDDVAVVTAPHAAILDCDDLDAMAVAEARELAIRLAPAPLIVLAGFPRADQVRAALAAGAAAVLAKPIAFDDLDGQLAAVGQKGKAVNEPQRRGSSRQHT